MDAQDQWLDSEDVANRLKVTVRHFGMNCGELRKLASVPSTGTSRYTKSIT